MYSDKELYAILMSDRKSKAWESYEQTMATIVSDLNKALKSPASAQDEVKEVLVEVAPVVKEDF